jgi:hypothetical protein
MGAVVEHSRGARERTSRDAHRGDLSPTLLGRVASPKLISRATIWDRGRDPHVGDGVSLLIATNAEWSGALPRLSFATHVEGDGGTGDPAVARR